MEGVSVNEILRESSTGGFPMIAHLLPNTVLRRSPAQHSTPPQLVLQSATRAVAGYCVGQEVGATLLQCVKAGESVVVGEEEGATAEELLFSAGAGGEAMSRGRQHNNNSNDILSNEGGVDKPWPAMLSSIFKYIHVVCESGV